MIDHGAIAARARGLTAGVIGGEALAALDAAEDAPALVRAITRFGAAPPAGLVDGDAIDRLARDRAAADHAILARWNDALAVLALDEDRRSLRAIVRGLAAGAPAERRLAGTVATPALPAAVLATLAAATEPSEIAAALARRHHPLAGALAAARTPVDPLDVELSLARAFAELARGRDPALRCYLAQLIDAENAAAALLLATRGDDIDPARAFLPGGQRVERAAFLAAAAGPLDASCAVLAAALAGTPLASAVFAPGPSAIEDAALAWQLATQARLRRIEPLGLAPALYLMLRRRDEARHLRRAAWRIQLQGPPEIENQSRVRTGKPDGFVGRARSTESGNREIPGRGAA